MFSASGTVITFRGFLAAYEEGADADTEAADGAAAAKETRLPTMAEGDALAGTDLAADGHPTSPPPRYTEASLVKALEERGIGRPSTYAATISTIQDRGYVTTRGQALVPTWLAFAVIRLLEEHFDRLVDYDFTADDGGGPRPDRGRVPGARGVAEGVLLRRGPGQPRHLRRARRGQRRRRSARARGEPRRDRRRARSTPWPSARASALRVGRYGPYLEDLAAEVEEGKTPPRASVPEDAGARRADRRQGPRAARRRGRRRPRARHATPRPATPSSRRTAATAPT